MRIPTRLAARIIIWRRSQQTDNIKGTRGEGNEGRMQASYRRSEVIWLLSMTREQAIEMDAVQRDSCADLAATVDAGPGSGDGAGVMVIARWNDVQRARKDLIREKEGLAILQMRAAGFSERALADLTGRDRLAIRRRWHATVDEIVERLGDGPVEIEAQPRVPVCLHCGERPRARLEAVKVRVKGGWKTVEPARQASVCVECITPELGSRIIRMVPAAA